jgi:hypothetical protein
MDPELKGRLPLRAKAAAQARFSIINEQNMNFCKDDAFNCGTNL